MSTASPGNSEMGWAGGAQAGQLAPGRLHSFFHPESVALVGATDASRWSARTFENWRTYSEDRPCYLVHPRHGTIHGQRAYPSLRAIGTAVDLCYVMVPTDQVFSVLEEAADLDIRNAIVLTAGFAEMGEEGKALEDRIAGLAAAHGMVILGPNSSGFINVAGCHTPYGIPIEPPLRSGPVGIVLQSGGLASAVLTMAQARSIDPSLVVSMGNEAMLSVTDVLAYLVTHEQTMVIAVFLETIRQPDRFRDVAIQALAAGKPIVALKVGRSSAGQQAALAHTGAVVGDAAVVRAAFSQLGIVAVDSLEDLLVTAGLLGSNPGRLGRRLAVVAASGGACDIIADRAMDEGIELPEFPSPTLSGLQEVLPPYSNPHNPLDVTGYVVVDASLSLRALKVVAASAAGTYDEILFQTTIPRIAPPDPAPLLERYSQLAALRDACAVPIVLQSTSSGDQAGFATTVRDRYGLHLLDGIEHGMSALGSAIRWQQKREWLLSRTPPASAPQVVVPQDVAGTYGESRARAFLAIHGVPVVPTTVVHSAAEATRVASDLGGAVVLKIASDGLLHKSDLGGVELDLRTADEITAAATRLLRLADRLGVAEEGIQVAPMRRGGVELLVSVTCDAAWGPVLNIAFGGIFVETLGDAVLRLLPVDEIEVESMLGELRGARLLDGARGKRPVDRRSLVSTVLALSRLGEGLGDALDTLEINPLWVGPEGCEALDALVIWRRPDRVSHAEHAWGERSRTDV